MSALAALDDRVGTLRLRSAADDPALGAACRSAVRSATMPRRGRQILVVRSLVVGVGADDAIGLQRDVSNEVDAAWRRARRPSEAGGADAVVFRDQAELLAHLVADIAANRATRRWWWAVIGEQIAPRGATAADVLARHPHDVPGAVVELDRLGWLEQVVARLDERGAIRVLDAVAAAFSLAVPTNPNGVAAVGGGIGLVERPAGAAGSARRRASPQLKLVHVARLLATDPSAARSASVLADERAASVARSAGVLADDAAASAQERIGGDSGDGAGLPQPSPPTDARRIGEHRDRDHRAGIPGSLAASAGPRRDHGRSPDAAADRRGEGDGHATSAEPRTVDATSPAVEPSGPLADPVVADWLGDASTIGADAIGSPPSAPALVDLATDWGGVFYLIAPTLELRVGEVFGDRFESTVGWWGCLELLARSLVPLGPDIDRDPVWDMLASLNGDRSAVDRLRTLRPADLRSAVEWSPGGDVSAGLAPLASTVASSLGRAWLDWLGRVRGRFAAHLCERLGLEADELVDVVLRHRAVISADRTHVEVFFPLAAAQLAVRRVGFDRDPGWVPELGRAVLFHFGDPGHDGGAS